MQDNPIKAIVWGSCLAVLIAGGTGCHSARYDQDFFDFDPQQSRTRAILDAQYAQGAADDQALREADFEGGRLSGLGRDKLDRMMAAGGEMPVVYLDVPESDPALTEARLLNVRAYLSASGRTPAADAVVIGRSPADGPARDSAAGLEMLEAKRTAMGTTPSTETGAAGRGGFLASE